eukprot:517945_1
MKMRKRMNLVVISIINGKKKYLIRDFEKWGKCEIDNDLFESYICYLLSSSLQSESMHAHKNRIQFINKQKKKSIYSMYIDNDHYALNDHHLYLSFTLKPPIPLTPIVLIAVNNCVCNDGDILILPVELLPLLLFELLLFVFVFT